MNQKGQARLPALEPRPTSLDKVVAGGRSDSGQALLIVVLVMVIGLTVGLSIASKSITSLRSSTDEANSQKALAAAEAGVEQAIKSNASIASSFTNNTTYDTTVTPVLGTSFLLNAGNPILADDGISLWLSDYSLNPADIYKNPWSGNLTVSWGYSSDGCSNAALEVAIISGTKASPVLTRYAFDPCQVRSSVNRFTYLASSGTAISGIKFFYKTTISISSGLLVKVIPLYSNTSTGVLGSTALPSQGSIITSTGVSGGTQRKVNVFQGYPEIPSEYFPYNLFSP